MQAINNATRIAKAANKAILTDLCNTIDIEKQKRHLTLHDRIPDKLVHDLVASIRDVCPQITRHTITNEYRRRKRLGIFYENLQSVSESEGIELIPEPVTPSPPRTKGGRPIGSTLLKREHTELSVIATKNEIATTFKRMRKESGKKRLKRGCLDELIKSVKQKNNLPDDLTISKQSIRQRLKPSQNLVVVNSHPGHTSPLADIEQDVVNIMIQMARLRQCVTPTQAIQLINAVIKGTTAQKKLESWKEKFSFGSEGRIGQSYWSNFKKRHSNKICSKKGQKYELDRAAWSTFANFSQMYTQIYEQMVEAKVAVELPDPVWMNDDGVVVCEADSTGCKVTHDLTHPEMCIVMDEVGGNINQKGDGNKGGEKYITGKGMVPQLKSNAKDKHYTVLGLTALSGDPVMCVVIFAGTREN